MELNIDDFSGEVREIAEEEFQADGSDELMHRLFEEWKAAGSPKELVKWIRTKLKEVFICAKELPKWPGEVHEWPEHEGKPMAFLGQMLVPAFTFASGQKNPQVIMFVFGAPDGPREGWTLVTKTMEQLASLKGVKIKRVVKGPDGY